MAIDARRAEAHGFWIGRGSRQRLCWIINGAFVTDHTLRRWVYLNTNDYVYDVVRQFHVDAYALAHQGDTHG